MGFLKFLKKKKKEEVQSDVNLDAPPSPPSIKEGLPKSEFGEKLPKEFPPFTFKEETPTVTEEKFPELPKEEGFGLEVPSFPPLEEKPEFMPKPPIKESAEIHLPEEGLIKPEEPVGEEVGGVVREERKPLSKKVTRKGAMYIRLDEFKETLKSINIIKRDLKKSDEFLHYLIESKEEKNKDFKKWHGIMKGIQTKLIFIEKTLFK